MRFYPLLLLAICVNVLGNEVRIDSAIGLVDLSNSVSTGTLYSGTTVYLDSDIVFTEELSHQFKPIGNFSVYFQGTFDRQGHIISKLTLKSSSQYVGLFGYSDGSLIKNVVLDESCSVTSSTSYSHNSVGSIIGYCFSDIFLTSLKML